MRVSEEIVAELDALHKVARRAFSERDIEAYRALFAEDLCYVQSNGTAIDREQLMRDVSQQLTRFRSVDTAYNRESLTMNDDGSVTQVLEQTARCSLRVFILFTKTWKLNRRGKYTYRKTELGWRITEVEVPVRDRT